VTFKNPRSGILLARAPLFALLVFAGCAPSRAIPGGSTGRTPVLAHVPDRAVETVPAAPALERARLAEIEEASHLTRGDLAVLLDQERELLRAPGEGRQIAGAIDLEGRQERAAIERVLQAGLLDVFPDGTFHPEDPVNRTQFAIVVFRILRKAAAADRVALPMPPEVSPYPDVPRNHYAYRAIAVATGLRILLTREDRAFGAADALTGADATRALRVLTDILDH
jgi:hypothetical protein